MIDHHVHVGWFSDGYHSPAEIWQAEKEAGIAEIVVSSTSTCAELYKLVVKEMRALIRLGGSRIHPVLWLTPRMMKTWGIRYMLRHSKVRWQGIKMHWEAHHEWYYNRKLLQLALDVARRLQVPVLLHTGEFKECKASVFMDVCRMNDDLTFVLAHGRPIKETIDVLSVCGNVFVDTAFMPVEHIAEIVQKGFVNRVLFGTDAPINKLFFPQLSTKNYILRCSEEFQSAITKEQYERIQFNMIYK